MSLQDTIAADRSAVDAAQFALDAANSQLATDTAKLASLQPQLDVYNALEAALARLPWEMNAGIVPNEFSDLIAKGRALLVA